MEALREEMLRYERGGCTEGTDNHFHMSGWHRADRLGASKQVFDVCWKEIHSLSVSGVQRSQRQFHFDTAHLKKYTKFTGQFSCEVTEAQIKIIFRSQQMKGSFTPSQQFIVYYAVGVCRLHADISAYTMLSNNNNS